MHTLKKSGIVNSSVYDLIEEARKVLTAVKIAANSEDPIAVAVHAYELKEFAEDIRLWARDTYAEQS